VLPPLRRPFKERTDMSTTSDAVRTAPEPDVAYTPHEHEELRELARAQRERRKVPFVVSAGSTAPKPA
jgi:glutaredoxin